MPFPVDERDIPVLNVDDRPTLHPVGVRTVIDRLHFCGDAQNRPELGQVGLEQSGQDDAAGILPFLERGRCLGHDDPRVAGEKKYDDENT
jgi:hypothetical protein